MNDIDILVIKVLFWTIHLRFEPKMIKNKNWQAERLQFSPRRMG